MAHFLTDNISIKVKSRYEASKSIPDKEKFIFSYHIDIINNSDNTVQLLSRHWHIFDSNGTYSEVKGEGVIGLKPIILPHKTHSYDSFCHLQTDIGFMWGKYLMKEVSSEKFFEATIPEFQLINPMRLN